MRKLSTKGPNDVGVGHVQSVHNNEQSHIEWEAVPYPDMIKCKTIITRKLTV